MTRIPSRVTRHAFPPGVWDTCRLNSVVVSTGIIDILVVSTYFQTGKFAEARIVNNQLLQDILLHVLPTDLPFVIQGNFNTDVRKLDACSTFSQLGCQEMFEFNRSAFGFELPPTCKGATRFDSMIIHPLLLKYIRRIDIGPEHQFADHCVAQVKVQFFIPTRTPDTYSWYAPKSWTLFPVKPAFFDAQYCRLRSQSSPHWSTDPARRLFQWSTRVESAVDHALRQHKQADPMSAGFPAQNIPGQMHDPKADS